MNDAYNYLCTCMFGLYTLFDFAFTLEAGLMIDVDQTRCADKMCGNKIRYYQIQDIYLLLIKFSVLVKA